MVGNSDNGSAGASAALYFIALAAALAILVYGSGFLIPLVIAFLIANLLQALIEHMRSIRIPAPLAVIFSIAFVALAMMAVILIILSQADAFVAALPRYIERVRDIGAQLLSFVGEQNSQRLMNALAGIDIASAASTALGSATSLLLNTGLVMLYVGFLLAERGRAANRLVAIADTPTNRSNISETINAISDGIRQYLFVKTIISLATSLFSYVVLRTLGLDFAETWAVLIFLFNFIPSVGSVLGVVFPALLALVQFESLTPFLVIAVGLAVVQFSIGNILEPMFMGRSLNLSSFAVIVALTFWTTIWGVAGAFLAVPITAGIVILCREIDQWKWVATLLSSDVPHESASPTAEEIP